MKLFVGGDAKCFPVVERGDCFVGIRDRLFRWEAWDGKTDASNLQEAERISGRDIVGIAQLTAGEGGAVVLDQANRPSGKYLCVVWTAEGEARILQSVKVIEYGPEEARARHAASPHTERAKRSGFPKAAFETIAELKIRLDDIPKIKEDVANSKANIEFLKKDRMAQRERASTAARQTRRDTKDSGLWSRYEAFRAMKRHLAQARKEHRRLTQLQAAQRVINTSEEKITVDAESLVRYYRTWLKKRSGSD